MRKTIGISLLVLMLTCSAQAGEIPTPVTEPQPLNAATQPKTDGEIHTPQAIEAATRDIVLSLLQSMLLVF